MHRILGKTQISRAGWQCARSQQLCQSVRIPGERQAQCGEQDQSCGGGQTQEETLGYDANGNAVSHTFGGGAVGEDRMMLWDETNMMKAIRMGELSFYHNIYDGTGTRVMKKGIGDIDVMTVGGSNS